jgi:hypothetical protein
LAQRLAEDFHNGIAPAATAARYEAEGFGGKLERKPK